MRLPLQFRLFHTPIPHFILQMGDPMLSSCNYTSIEIFSVSLLLCQPLVSHFLWVRGFFMIKNLIHFLYEFVLEFFKGYCPSFCQMALDTQESGLAPLLTLEIFPYTYVFHFMNSALTRCVFSIKLPPSADQHYFTASQNPSSWSHGSRNLDPLKRLCESFIKSSINTEW